MAESKPKSFRVGIGHRFVTVSAWKSSSGVIHWRFRRRDGRDAHITRKSRTAAKQAASDHLTSLENQDRLITHLEIHHRQLLAQVMETLPTTQDLQAFQEWRQNQTSTLTLKQLAKDYLKFKILQKGQKTEHLRDVERHLTSLYQHLGENTPIISVTTSQLSAWITTRMTVNHEDGSTSQLSASRYNNTRTAATALWNWAYKQGHLTHDQHIIASRLPTQFVAPKNQIRYATNDEALLILREVQPDYRLTLVLGLFAGLRPEETASKTNAGSKTSLNRNAIDLDRKAIYISRDVAKGEKRPARIVPITPCLEAWLKWAGFEPGQSGRIAPKSLAQARETGRLGKILNQTFQRKEGWPHDWLRHTYGTNRNAIKRNLARVAEEMGTSVNMMEAHYHQPIAESAGESFFALRPSDLDGTGDRVTHHQFTA